MKQVVCEAPGSLSLLNVPEPEGVASWVPIDVRAVGLCGSDYHIFGGTQPYLTYPRVMGHELAGVVAQEWAGSDFSPGQRVLINPYISCGQCSACDLGKPNCCENIEVLGVHRDGGMCERVWVPKANLIDADGLDFNQAAMVEFLSVGRHAIARTAVRAKSRVLVVGGGPIGLGAALFAQLEGAIVTVADVSESKRSIIQTEFSLRAVDPVRLDGEVEREGLYEHVFDATGAISAMNKGLDYVAHGGTYTLLSVVQGNLNFSDQEFHKKEVTLYASRNALRADFNHVIDCMKSEELQWQNLLTHRSTLEDSLRDIPDWAADRNAVIKAVIEINQ